MPLGTGNQTVTTTTQFAPTVWANDVMDILKSNLILILDHNLFPYIRRYLLITR